MTTGVEELSGLQVLEGVFQGLGAKFNGIDFTLPTKIHAYHAFVADDGDLIVEVADDSDYHRTNTGSMIYSKFKKMKFENNERVLGYSQESQGYPAGNYRGDITVLGDPNHWGALESEEGRKRLEEDLNKSNCFSKSLFGIFSGGELFCSNPRNEWGRKHPFSEDMSPLIQACSQYVRRGAERDPNHILFSTLSHPVVSGVRYDPRIVPYLVEETGKILSK